MALRASSRRPVQLLAAITPGFPLPTIAVPQAAL